MSTTDGMKKIGLDQNVEADLDKHCEQFGLTPLDAVKMFPVLARRQWLKRFMAHHQLFLQTLEVPGDIVELGVFRGTGMFTWANFLEAYAIGDRTKIVYGFDNWEGFREFSPEDGPELEHAHKTVGNFSPEAYWDELQNAIRIFDNDRFIPQKARIKLIKGQIEETAPKFVEDNPGVRFSLIHFDCDLYKPTKAALNAFWPRLSRGGLMLFDEYSIADWPGETKAVDEFLEDKPGLQIKTLQWTNTPAGYLVKP